jgi:DNA polymerase III alpha subunit
MSTKLIELEDRIITDKGEVVAKLDLLLKKALSHEIFTNILTEDHDEVRLYNKKMGKTLIPIWKNEKEEYPSDNTYQWTIPLEYQTLNIEELVIQNLIHKQLIKKEYVERLELELNIMEEKNMFPFIRCLLYVVDSFKKNNVVWGIGRGSSCASLILYILDINKVDPVKYNIPHEEFFK